MGDREMSGAGTELEKLLAWFHVFGEAGCGCHQKAMLMDEMGPDWCEQNEKTILGWLAKAAEDRGLPFIEVFAAMLLHKAIRKARKNPARVQP